MNNDMMTPLSLDDTFSFSCTERVPCFNECCRDLNQFLTPYDILRLKNHFDIPSNLFLERYTIQHIGPESGLPIITLKTNDTLELTCPFVTPSGCSVYDDRPSSCRTYPLVRVASRSRETGKITEQYMLLKEPHCLGFDQGKMQTVREWIASQGIAVYNEMNDLLMEIISLKNRLMPGPLDIKSRIFFYTACYDLDRFRSHIFEKGILKDHNLDAARLDLVKQDDTALLRLGLESIKKVLFGDRLNG
jgi:Fe-S-cluster containining protein